MPPLPLVALLLFVAQPGAYAFLGGDGRSGEALPTVRPPAAPYGSLFSQVREVESKKISSPFTQVQFESRYHPEVHVLVCAR
jgi:hypothetical protein